MMFLPFQKAPYGMLLPFLAAALVTSLMMAAPRSMVF
jgi:hypothetical protein